MPLIEHGNAEARKITAVRRERQIAIVAAEAVAHVETELLRQPLWSVFTVHWIALRSPSGDEMKFASGSLRFGVG